MFEQQTGPVFAALGDDTRRRLVEILADGRARRVSELARDLAVTRQAVAKHLDILASAGLTGTTRRGRERLTALDPGAFQPLEDWLRRYDRFWDERLEVLKRRVEAEEPS